MQAERLLKIIFLLMNGTCRTAKGLAQSCSVSVRTIQRDINTLSLAGIPVFANRGYGGGVGLLKEFTLDKTYLTEQERADILNGLQALEGAGYPDGKNSLQKLAALFHSKADERWLRVDFSSWCGSGFGKQKFDALKDAVLGKNVLAFSYYSSENRISERVADPLKDMTDKGECEAMLDGFGMTDKVQRDMYREAMPRQFSMLYNAGCLMLPFFKVKEPLLKPSSLSSLNDFASIWCCIENMLLALGYPAENAPIPVQKVIHAKERIRISSWN